MKLSLRVPRRTLVYTALSRLSMAAGLHPLAWEDMDVTTWARAVARAGRS